MLVSGLNLGFWCFDGVDVFYWLGLDGLSSRGVQSIKYYHVR
jgi:hypothetical protein